MLKRSTVGGCASILAIVMLASAQAGDNLHQTTYVTFSGPVGLPGVTLPAGTYVLELADPYVRTDIVRVLNRDHSRAYFTAFTEKTERPRGWPANRSVVIGEARPGGVPPILVWYPSGDPQGRRFIYSGNGQ